MTTIAETGTTKEFITPQSNFRTPTFSWLLHYNFSKL